MAERQWSEQFLGMLEALRMPAVFAQGRRYARSGQVRDLSISASLASALVLDENGQTYRARIAVRAFSNADWHRIERVLAGQAIYAAKLLAGQLPDDLDQLLAGFGLSLFPDSFADMAIDCSCPSWHSPCRHLAATAYALARSFDTDPFGILTWRGRGRDELLARLRTARGAPPPAPAPVAPAASTLAGFWTAGPRVPAPMRAAPGTVRRADAVLDQLDPLNLTAGRHDVTDLLRTAYRKLVDPPAKSL
jgi:uncharacterized Zn finger protein